MTEFTNLEAEQALIGAILVENDVLSTLPPNLSPTDFGEAVHARIYEAASTLIRAGKLASPVTLKTYFDHDKTLNEIGGTAYLARLAAAATTVINAPEYARLVLDLSLRRKAITTATQAVIDLRDPPVDVDAEELVSEVARDLAALAEGCVTTRSTFSAGATVAAAIDEAASAYQLRGKRPDAILTGIQALDWKVGGLIRGDLVIIGGRPSMGKTALGLQLLHNAARASIPSLFVSLEMRAGQLGHRLLSMRTGIEYRRIAWGQISELEFNKIFDAGRILETMPFTIEDRAGITAPGFAAVVARAKMREPGLGLVVLDYLSLVAPGDRYRGRKVDELAEISAECKRLAKQYDVAFVVLQQLSRALENRDNKRPSLADLRDSGAIEQDADLVLFPYRESYYVSRELDALDPDSSGAIELSDQLRKVGNDLELIIAKNRQGSTGTVRLFADMACNIIRDHDTGAV